MEQRKVCELCDEEASVYCISDSAFLCWKCDTKVHSANFLVARHVRRTICSVCNDFDGKHVSGVSSEFPLPVCGSCLSDDDIESSTCMSSDIYVSKIVRKPCRSLRKQSSSLVTNIARKQTFCLGKITEGKKPRTSTNAHAKAESILVQWCRKLGLGSNLVRLATRAFIMCSATLPFRASLASSLWFSLKISRSASVPLLGRLEEISGVPAKLILLAELKISGTIILNVQQERAEGWAECSD